MLPIRSAGRPEVIFVIERLIDLVADRLGLDPVALRRRNIVPPTAQPFTNPLGLTYDSGRYEEAMDAVTTARSRFRHRHPINYFEVFAASAWLERRALHTYTDDTRKELARLDESRAHGLRARLVAQGFLG